MSRPRLTLLCRAAVLAGIAAAAAPAALRAQTPTASKVLYACHVPSSGTVYRVEEVNQKEGCAESRHVQFSWADQPAPQVTTVLGEVRTVSANANGEATVTCPAGSYAMGGGYQLVTPSDAPQPLIYFSGPQLDPANTSWVVSIHNSQPNTTDVKLRAFVRCTR